MTQAGTLSLMRPTTGLELAGVVARLEVDSNGTVVAAEERTGIARSNLYRIFDADPKATSVLYRRFERAFGFPPFLFDHIIDLDAEWIAGREMDQGVKGFILDAIAEIKSGNETPKSRRRRA